jgi:hypothetical protein
LFATLPQNELIKVGRQLVQFELEIGDLSPASPETADRARELQSKIDRLRQRYLTLTTGFDDNDRLLPIFSSNNCFGVAKRGADSLTTAGAVTPRNARHARNNARVRLVGAIGLAFAAMAVFDPHLSSRSRSLLPSQPMAMAMGTASLAAHDNVSIIQKKPSQVQNTSWSTTLFVDKLPFAKRDSAPQVKTKRGANKQLSNGLQDWTHKAATGQGWQLVVIETKHGAAESDTPKKAASLGNFKTSNLVNQFNQGTASASSASEVIRR